MFTSPTHLVHYTSTGHLGVLSEQIVHHFLCLWFCSVKKCLNSRQYFSSATQNFHLLLAVLSDMKLNKSLPYVIIMILKLLLKFIVLTFCIPSSFIAMPQSIWKPQIFTIILKQYLMMPLLCLQCFNSSAYLKMKIEFWLCLIKPFLDFFFFFWLSDQRLSNTN